jgi:excisionase family DNA binding protein
MGKQSRGEEMPKQTAPQMLDRDYFTVKQAAAYLQVSTRTIARYIDRGTLTASQLVPGGTIRISVTSIEKLLGR